MIELKTKSKKFNGYLFTEYKFALLIDKWETTLYAQLCLNSLKSTKRIHNIIGKSYFIKANKNTSILNSHQ